MINTNKVTTNALLVVGGSIVGAGLGLLFAPQAGKRTRRDISRFADRVSDRTSKAVDEITDNVRDFADSAGKKAAGFWHRGKKLTLDAKKSLRAAI